VKKLFHVMGRRVVRDALARRGVWIEGIKLQFVRLSAVNPEAVETRGKSGRELKRRGAVGGDRDRLLRSDYSAIERAYRYLLASPRSKKPKGNDDRLANGQTDRIDDALATFTALGWPPLSIIDDHLEGLIALKVLPLGRLGGQLGGTPSQSQEKGE
jgi:hypothetical protein